jgi:hypothetical protein
VFTFYGVMSDNAFRQITFKGRVGWVGIATEERLVTPEWACVLSKGGESDVGHMAGDIFFMPPSTHIYNHF